MNNKTEMGLLLIVAGMVLSLFADLSSVAAGGLGGSTLSPGMLIPAILGIFAFIIMFVGWIFILIGRKEFGEKHAQFVIYSIIAFIVGVSIVIIGCINLPGAKVLRRIGVRCPHSSHLARIVPRDIALVPIRIHGGSDENDKISEHIQGFLIRRSDKLIGCVDGTLECRCFIAMGAGVEDYDSRSRFQYPLGLCDVSHTIWICEEREVLFNL